jgi:NADPH:quinone reductase-like Zn-dependent oxidoreductase
MASAKTMRAFQYTTTKGGLEKNLILNPHASIPIPKDPSSQHLVQIISTCLNPIDYKPAEVLPSFMLPKPATPGIDFVGKIVTPANGSNLKKGQMVFGVAGLSPMAGGALADYAIARKEGVAPLPPNVKPSDAATIGVGGLTAYQSIVPHVKRSDRLFINGGSGGTGSFALQIAKEIGCWVVTTCSTVNVDLCKSLGADEVIDYKKGSVLEALKKMGNFDHVVDNVGNDQNLYWKAHEYTKPSAKFVGVAAEPSLRYATFAFKTRVLPTFLSGGKRQYVSILAEPRLDQLEQIGTWIGEGKVKAVIDQRFLFEQAPDAIRKLKTGRARGKIMIDIAPETAGEAGT